jgi:hypothetical protein
VVRNLHHLKPPSELNHRNAPFTGGVFVSIKHFYMEEPMTRNEFYDALVAKIGEDRETIERLGFEPDRKEYKRHRRLKFWRQQRREKNLANIAAKIVQS